MASLTLEQQIRDKYKQQRERCNNEYLKQWEYMKWNFMLMQKKISELEEQELSMINGIVGVREEESRELESLFGNDMIPPQIISIKSVKEEGSTNMMNWKQENSNQESKERKIKFKQESKCDEYDNNGIFSANQDSAMTMKQEKIEWDKKSEQQNGKRKWKWNENNVNFEGELMDTSMTMKFEKIELEQDGDQGTKTPRKSRTNKDKKDKKDKKHKPKSRKKSKSKSKSKTKSKSKSKLQSKSKLKSKSKSSPKPEGMDYNCNDCNMENMTRDQAFDHFKNVHFQKSIYVNKVGDGQCPICGEKFNDKEARGESYLGIHFESVHANTGNFTQATTDTQHWECKQCNLAFKSKSELLRHQDQCNPVCKFICPIKVHSVNAAKKFKSPHELINHWATNHIKEEFYPFVCDAAGCPKKCPTIQRLNVHINNHSKQTGQRNYKCQKQHKKGCLRRFVNESNLSSHDCTRNFWEITFQTTITNSPK